MTHWTRLLSLLPLLLSSSPSDAAPMTAILDINPDTSFIEGCAGFTNICDRAGVSGQIRLTFDEALGTASLEYLSVMTTPILDLPPSPISLANSLLFDSEGFLGDRLLTFAPGFAWNFGGASEGRAVELLLFLSNVAPGTNFSFSGGWDESLVDGPRVRINLVGVVIPEPHMALLLGIGLAGLAMRPGISKVPGARPNAARPPKS